MGEVQAHLAEVYGAEVSRQTISTITDKVVDAMTEWQNRPLDPVAAIRRGGEPAVGHPDEYRISFDCR